MSIASEISALTTDRNNIRSALVAKGVTGAGEHGFDSFATDIAAIPAGSGSGGDSPLDALSSAGWGSSDIEYLNDYYSSSVSESVRWYSDTSQRTDFTHYFSGSKSLVYAPKLDTSAGTRFVEMFLNCNNLEFVPDLDTSNAVFTDGMFQECYNLREIPNLDLSHVEGARDMFRNCETIKTAPSLSFSSSLESAADMFKDCYFLKSVGDLRDVSNLWDVQEMFDGCGQLVSVGRMNFSSVTSTDYMFRGCTSLVDLGGFDDLGVDLDLRDCGLLSTESVYNLSNRSNNSVSKTLILHPSVYAQIPAWFINVSEQSNNCIIRAVTCADEEPGWCGDWPDCAPCEESCEDQGLCGDYPDCYECEEEPQEEE